MTVIEEAAPAAAESKVQSSWFARRWKGVLTFMAFVGLVAL
jgi:hypothetical protein